MHPATAWIQAGTRCTIPEKLSHFNRVPTQIKFRPKKGNSSREEMPNSWNLKYFKCFIPLDQQVNVHQDLVTLSCCIWQAIFLLSFSPILEHSFGCSDRSVPIFEVKLCPQHTAEQSNFWFHYRRESCIEFSSQDCQWACLTVEYHGKNQPLLPQRDQESHQRDQKSQPLQRNPRNSDN